MNYNLEIKAKKAISIIILLTVFTIFSHSMGGKIEIVPMKIKKLLIQNHECLVYVKYVGNEKESEIFHVYDINAQENTITIYEQHYMENSDLLFPRHFTNFTDYKKISLSNYCLISAHSDELTNFILENKKGIVQSDLQIDSKKGTAGYLEALWDGYELITRHSIIKIKTDFPVWDMGSLLFVGTRFLDIKAPGIIYGLIPNIIKQPIPLGFKYIGKEIIETKAGKFNTIKVAFYSTDPFLSKLMESYSKEMFYWINESEDGMIIKIQMPGIAYLLEKKSVWEEIELSLSKN
jgi:hypothetical protein